MIWKFTSAISSAVMAALTISGQAQPPAASTGTQTPGPEHRAAESLQRKLDHIAANGQLAHPDQTPTVMTEAEINDYFAAGKVRLPEGVKKVTLQGVSGSVTGLLLVDFDQMRAGQRSANPLLALFTGVHEVRIDADAAGAGGKGKIHVRTVSLDGVEVPRIALEYFVSKYVTAKYPGIGLDSEFQMPHRIDTAEVGDHQLTVTQK